MKYKIVQSLLVVLAGSLAPLAESKSLVDYFLPMEPQGPLVSEGIWGETNALPRDIHNGLEDPDLSDWCYWDGKIVKDDAGKYHMYASRWNQTNAHSKGWNTASKGTHAVSDHLLGPYEDLGEIWSDWKDGAGHNVIGLRLPDGRYAAVASEGTPGDVFVSDSPDGPFEHLGEFKIDPNGYYAGLGRYDELDSGAVKAGVVGNLSNAMLIVRPDGRYMIVARHCAPMISDDGILGPYKIMADKAWRGIEGLPQIKMEDPTVWYSDGLYHIVVNYHGNGNVSYHLTSEDGIHNWKNRGIAFDGERKDFFRYTDGTSNWWYIVQRPTVYTEDGLVKAFNFSVIDVHKGRDRGNDNHGSKIVVVPFDGEAFSKQMKKTVRKELAKADRTRPPAPWKSVNTGAGSRRGNTGYETEFNTMRVKAPGRKDACRFVYQKMTGDISATVQVLSQDISDDPVKAGLMFRKSLEMDTPSVFASISRPGGFIFEGQDTVIASRALKAPYWLRMEKRGGRITAYISSSNRMNWKKAGETEVELGDEFYVGMAVASQDTDRESLARFKDPELHNWGQPLTDGIVNHTFPDLVPADGKITFEVEVESNVSAELYVELEHVHTHEKFVALRHRLKKKTGTVELTYDVGELQSGEPYWFVIKMIPLHGHESEALQSMFKKVWVK
ncbi:glycoside hydrolase family protein [Pontiella agarivorans]|uniref:Glycoside hydrolase family protein n=1 Tax=Pontiella agarivorans TaxID=3038953 RepID=A0ABU5N0R1_9BACT|nr:glycoside hydrolase family protein [Pontiella agarivorans]MDZ8120008.1 glycoside hydrolase family protein [Pontiella agarivorans]